MKHTDNLQNKILQYCDFIISLASSVNFLRTLVIKTEVLLDIKHLHTIE